MLGASQPQLSVHDSGNSKLGYTWPGCHQPPGRRCCAIPGHCHRPGCTIATTAALSPEEKSEPSSNVESGHAGDTGDRGHCSSAVLQCCSAAGGVTTPGRASVLHGNHRCIFSHRRRDMSREHRAVWRYHQEETWKSGHRNGNSALYTLTDSRLANCPWFIPSFV